MSADAINKKAITLVLLTNHFPFGDGEAFLENEIDFLCKEFNVLVITKNTTDSLRPGYSHITVERTSKTSTVRDWPALFWKVLKKLPLLAGFVVAELSVLKNQHQVTKTGVWGKLLHDLLQAVVRSNRIEMALRKHRLSNRVILYSYWMDNNALASLLVHLRGTEFRRISRTHGGDLYRERNKLNYLSFRTVLIKNLERVFPISQHGADYLIRSTSEKYSRKVIVSRLGTKPTTLLPGPNREVTKLVSCSFMLKVKRIHKIIEALSMLDGPVHWTHIGDGPLRQELEALAKLRLEHKTNIRYNFAGKYTNTELLRYYQSTPLHYFINTSESEGIPVTIMEAQSFGIPAIAPEAGGIPEIVNAQNGYLFPVNTSDNNLAAILEGAFNLPENQYAGLRQKSYANWQERYNADKNFPTFVNHLTAVRTDPEV